MAMVILFILLRAVIGEPLPKMAFIRSELWLERLAQVELMQAGVLTRFSPISLSKECGFGATLDIRL